MTNRTYKGTCVCGAVELTASGTPLFMGYCHCDACRRWSASPLAAFTFWRPDAVKIVAGAAELGSYSKTPKSVRKWCKICGGHVLVEHPGIGVTEVPAAVFRDLDFKPREHLHYQEAVLRIVDSLPKNKDLPKSSGGSGVLLPS
jgi:hypothetical protein